MSFIRKRFSRASANPGTGASDDHQRFVGCLFGHYRLVEVRFARDFGRPRSLSAICYWLLAIREACYWLFAKRAIGEARDPFLDQGGGLQQFADWVPTTVNQCVPRARANRHRKLVTSEANPLSCQIDGHLALRFGLDNLADPAEVLP